MKKVRAFRLLLKQWSSLHSRIPSWKSILPSWSAKMTTLICNSCRRYRECSIFLKYKRTFTKKNTEGSWIQTNLPSEKLWLTSQRGSTVFFASDAEREILKKLQITKTSNHLKSLACRKVLANRVCITVVISKALSESKRALWKGQD